MTLAEQFSTSNVVNSISLELAGYFLTAGYVVYWQKVDALQTGATTWYYEYSANCATLLANAGFVAVLTAAKGILTITDRVPAYPRYIIRPINSGVVPAEDEVMVPAVSVEVGPGVSLRNAEMGSRLKVRARHLIVDAYVRTVAEQAWFQDKLALWFDDEEMLTVHDHDAGNLADVGAVLVQKSVVVAEEVLGSAEARTYEVLLNARLVYEA
jgi:hypothetical protein